jgi:hypothetical protein
MSERASQAGRRRIAESQRDRGAIRGPHEIAQCFRGVYVRSREEVS